MRSVGIICEYNPFHNGHKNQIDILRSMGYDCIVCIMSGNYTQRGEPAIFDKYTRAKSAILGGADIVFELPFPYSSFSAEGFAASGVHILASLGISDICFGSESVDKQLLTDAAAAVLSPDFPSVYAAIQRKSSTGSASAYFEAIKSISGATSVISSNDILAISYICAIERQHLTMNIIPIKREGAAYREQALNTNEYPSASALRSRLKNDKGNVNAVWTGHIPNRSLASLANAHEIGLGAVFTENISNEILAFFKLMTPTEIVSRAIARSGGGNSIAEDGCGICERLCNAAKNSHTLEEFLSRAYNSKYTDSRINRVMLFSLLGVSDAITRTLPEYTTLLAASEIGRELLSAIRKTSKIPIVTKPADAPSSTVSGSILSFSDALYASAIPSCFDADYFIKKHPFMLKDDSNL